MTGSDHYAMRLNNFAQDQYGRDANRRVQYQVAQGGPQHHTVWQGVYHIDGTTYGTGTSGTTKSAAKEAAAKRTIEQLEQKGNIIP